MGLSADHAEEARILFSPEHVAEDYAVAKRRRKDGSEYEPLPNEAAFNAEKEKLRSSEYGLAALHEKYGCYVYPPVAKRIVGFFQRHPKATVREAALRLKVSQAYCWQVKRERVDVGIKRKRPERPADAEMTWVATKGKNGTGGRWTRRIPGPKGEDRVWVGIRTLKKEFPQLVKDNTRQGTVKAANAWWRANYSIRFGPGPSIEDLESGDYVAPPPSWPISFQVWLRSLNRLRLKLGEIRSTDQDERVDRLVRAWTKATEKLLKRGLD